MATLDTLTRRSRARSGCREVARDVCDEVLLDGSAFVEHAVGGRRDKDREQLAPPQRAGTVPLEGNSSGTGRRPAVPTMSPLRARSPHAPAVAVYSTGAQAETLIRAGGVRYQPRGRRARLLPAVRGSRDAAGA